MLLYLIFDFERETDGLVILVLHAFNFDLVNKNRTHAFSMHGVISISMESQHSTIILFESRIKVDFAEITAKPRKLLSKSTIWSVGVLIFFQAFIAVTNIGCRCNHCYLCCYQWWIFCKFVELYKQWRVDTIRFCIDVIVILSYHRDKIALNYRFVTFRTFQSLKEIFVEFITPSHFDRMVLLNLYKIDEKWTSCICKTFRVFEQNTLAVFGMQSTTFTTKFQSLPRQRSPWKPSQKK